MLQKGTILIAEDEESIRRLLRASLQRAGFKIAEATTGKEALVVVARQQIQLAIIDVMLPELDGFDVVRRIRTSSTMPIIIVTARGEETSRVVGLEIGADDYVVKPFFADEVVARVRALLRRAQGLHEDRSPLTVGRLTLDPAERRGRLDNQPIDLTRREFDLLAALMRHPGRVYSRRSLLADVWKTEHLTEKTVDVHVNGLRAKLRGAVTIAAVRGIGYRLEEGS